MVSMVLQNTFIFKKNKYIKYAQNSTMINCGKTKYVVIIKKHENFLKPLFQGTQSDPYEIEFLAVEKSVFHFKTPVSRSEPPHFES